jgi:hypothetical protein
MFIMSHMFFSVIYICFNKEKQSLIPTPQRHCMCSFICFVVMLFVVLCLKVWKPDTGFWGIRVVVLLTYAIGQNSKSLNIDMKKS